MKAKSTKLNFKEKLDDDNLDLSLSGLELVPVKEISEITKARKLNLAYNSLTFLPDDFATKLSFIRELDLSKNRLQSLPKNFGCMGQLKTLDLLGNQLVDLPASFIELKNLRWLDLKDNQLNVELKKAVGECGNEDQCKKCASNVMKYVKYASAENERQKQIHLKLKKEEESRINDLEKQKATLAKDQKKEERERRRIVNEQRKIENDLKKQSSESYQKEKSSGSTKTGSDKKSTSVCGLVFKSTIYLILMMVIAFGVYMMSINYCNRPEVREMFASYEKSPYLKPIFNVINKKLCPLTKIKHPFVESLLKAADFTI